MTELWKDIKGYEGLYQVSNMGRVRSLNYQGHGETRVIVPKQNNRGRLWFDLWKNGKGKPMLAHRLVAIAFIPNPLDLPEINHIDENPKNNVVENLEWCTRAENINKWLSNHPKTRSEVKRYSGKYQKRSHLVVDQITKSGELVRRWANSNTVAKETGMSDWSISECCRGNRKTAYGYIWRYADEYICGKETT